MEPAVAVMAERATTVTDAVEVHPPSVYVIVAEPAATPETVPDDDPAAAIPALLLLHVPDP